MNSLSRGERGVVAVIGFIFIFGILVVSFSIYQASVIPDQNEEVEFDHFLSLGENMVELHQTVHRTRYENTATTDIDIRDQYPTRVLGVNPGPFTTDVYFGSSGELVIRNFEVVSDGNEQKYWTSQSELIMPTSALFVEPDYNVLQSETYYVYDNQIVSTQYEEQTVANKESTDPIQDNKIDVQTLTGDISNQYSGVQQLEVESISSSEDSLYITGDSANPIVLETNTALSETIWNSILEPQSSDHIQSVSVNNRVLTVKLDPSETYSVDAHLSSINPTDSTRSIGDPSYILSDSGNTVLSNQPMRVQVKDSLGNGVSGATVDVTSDPQNCISDESKITNRDGYVSFRCSLSDGSDSASVEFSINSQNNDYEDVSFNVSSINPESDSEDEDN